MRTSDLLFWTSSIQIQPIGIVCSLQESNIRLGTSQQVSRSSHVNSCWHDILLTDRMVVSPVKRYLPALPQESNEEKLVVYTIAGMANYPVYVGTIINHCKDPVVKQPGFHGTDSAGFFFIAPEVLTFQARLESYLFSNSICRIIPGFNVSS